MAEQKEKVFVDGLFVDVKQFDNGGEVIKLSITVDKLKAFLDTHANEKGYVNIDVLTNQADKKYAVLNTFQPKTSDLPF